MKSFISHSVDSSAELQHGSRFPSQQKGAVYKSHAGQQYCMEVKHGARKTDGKSTKDREIHGESNVWSTAQKIEKYIWI